MLKVNTPLIKTARKLLHLALPFGCYGEETFIIILFKPANCGIKQSREATHTRPPCFLALLVQVILQLAAAAWMAQLAQSLGLNLANTLTGNVKLFANFFQGTTAAIVEAET